MESGGVAGAGGGSGGGPAPFLLKTYEMVDDASTDDIVSWSSKKNSFVVWNPPEFARVLLPTYFKHNNFSSFIRQLNTYGFRKTDPERWEFTNEDFVKDQKNLLKNIHRRKPIHSHSHPQGSLPEAEKAALDEEIEKLTKEKNTLQTDLWKFRHHQTGTKVQLDNLEEKVHDMEQRQLRLMNFLARAIHNPNFVEHLIGMASDTSIDFLALNKKRRLPKVNLIQEDVETSFVDNSSSNSKSDFGNVCHRDFFNKLKLELSPAVSDSNLLAPSAQSSNEDGGSQDKKTSGGNQKEDGNIRAEGLLFVAETFDVSDTGASFTLRTDRPLSKQVRDTNLYSMDECDAHVPCHLNLTLASSALQDDSSHHSSAKVNLFTSGELRSSANDKEPDHKTVSKNFTSDNVTKSTSPEAALINNQGHGPGQGRENDMFWEQFLTERPGSSDTEEAISTFRANNNSYEDQEEGNGQNGKSWKVRTDMKQLTL